MSTTLRKDLNELLRLLDANAADLKLGTGNGLVVAGAVADRIRAALAAHTDYAQPEPPEGVNSVTDETEGDGEDSNQWGRTFDGEWKGYKDGGKCYLGWDELVRRWGPITWDGAK